ncbi:MAG: AAA family ATPase [Promethearchaeota archaeon]
MTDEISEEDTLRKKIWRIINVLQAHQLFVHSKVLEIKFFDKKARKIKTQKLPEIITLCVLNALVPNSAMLLIGPPGTAKTSLVKLLGRMFTSSSLNEIENAIVRGHPQLTEEKLVGTLKLGKLMKEGKEVVIWRKFITNFWKIIDEVNRLTPYAQDILLSLLAEGTVKYFDEVLSINKYCLYATINPQDVGTFELSRPFLDRFGISVQVSIPSSLDLNLILTGKDEKYSGWDEYIQVPEILSIDELMEIWYYINKIELNDDAVNYIHAIIREFSLCDRVDKGNSENLKPSAGLCSDCHFNTSPNICNKIDSPLSVRAAKDLIRYSKALVWLLNQEEIDINVINTLAPYIISHRVYYVQRELEKPPYWGDKYKFSKDILETIRKRYFNRKQCYEITQRFRDGKYTEQDLNILNKFKKSDLIVKYDLFPYAKMLKNKKYSKMAKEIIDVIKTGNVEKLSEIRNKLISMIDFPNRAYLISLSEKELYKQTVSYYNFKYMYKDDIWADIVVEFPELNEPLKEAFSKRQTLQVRVEDLIIEINVTGTNEDSLVNMQISGGSKAIKLRELLNKLDFLMKEN